jgi:hypothetical protein
VDNAVVKVADPVFLGYCIEQGADVGGKAVAKVSWNEKVGLPATLRFALPTLKFGICGPQLQVGNSPICPKGPLSAKLHLVSDQAWPRTISTQLFFSCAAPTVCVQVGVFANVRGEFSVVEYSDISEVLARRITTTGQLMLSASHVCINYYTRDFLEASFRFVAAIACLHLIFMRQRGVYT